MPSSSPHFPQGVSVAVLNDDAVALKHMDLPARRSGEIDVAIEAAAICGSDVHTVLGHRTVPSHAALGHEGIGRVVDVDKGTADLSGAPIRRGDRVAIGLFRACGVCDRCTSGLDMKCRSLVKYGHESVFTAPHATGMLATGVRLLPGVPVVSIPDDIEIGRMVSAGCAVATAAAIVAAAGLPRRRSDVLVFGAGAVGAYVTAMLTTIGWQVYVRDPAPSRLAAIRRFGARIGAPDVTGFPVVIDASGSAKAVDHALHSADLGGHVILAGSVSPGSFVLDLDPALLVTHRLTVTGVHNYTSRDFGHAVDWLLGDGRDFDFGSLVSPPVRLSSIGEAFQLMESGRYHRVLVQPDVDDAPLDTDAAVVPVHRTHP